MAVLNLKELQPNKVSKNISSYSTLLFGQPKVGKSRLAAEFPKPIFFATEPTQTTIPGAYIVPITKWSEFKQYLRQLKDQELKDTFSTVVIDTIDLASSYAEKYICQREGVESIKDIAWGTGYKMVENEFRDTLFSIRQEGYGLVMISHVTSSTFTREDGTEYNENIPALPDKRTRGVVENLADIYAYAHMVKVGDSYERVLTLRAVDPTTPAGSHFKYLPESVPLDYNALASALSEAIDKEEAEVGKQFFTQDKTILVTETKQDFNELMAEFDEMVAKLQDVTGGAFGTQWAPRIAETVAKYLGKGKKISECTPDQVDVVELIVNDLKEQIGNGI